MSNVAQLIPIACRVLRLRCRTTELLQTKTFTTIVPNYSYSMCLFSSLSSLDLPIRSVALRRPDRLTPTNSTGRMSKVQLGAARFSPSAGAVALVSKYETAAGQSSRAAAAVLVRGGRPVPRVLRVLSSAYAGAVVKLLLVLLAVADAVRPPPPPVARISFVLRTGLIHVPLLRSNRPRAARRLCACRCSGSSRCGPAAVRSGALAACPRCI